MDDGYTLNDLVASEIRGWLGKRRMSGRQLAAKLGTSQTWMSTRLRGTTEIGLTELERIAAALEVDVADLLPRPSMRGTQSNRGSHTLHPAATGHLHHPAPAHPPNSRPVPVAPEPAASHAHHGGAGRSRGVWTSEGAAA